jgi:hypothetical protein
VGKSLLDVLSVCLHLNSRFLRFLLVAPKRFNYSYKSHVFSTTSYVPQKADRNLPQYKLILNNMYRIRPNTALLGYYQGYLSSYFLKLKATMLWQQNKCTSL